RLPLPPYSVFSYPAPPATPTSPPSLHDALPIYDRATSFYRPRQHLVKTFFIGTAQTCPARRAAMGAPGGSAPPTLALVNVSKSLDRKSTRLNSSHVKISYAVFCLKKKNKKKAEQ